jgi:hypothetical protein
VVGFTQILTTEVAVAAQRDTDEQADLDDELGAQRPQFWSDLRIDPVEIALPKGVGYTLRAYRLSTEVTPTDVSERESDEFPDRQYPAAVQEEEFDFGDEFGEEDPVAEDSDEDELDDLADDEDFDDLEDEADELDEDARDELDEDGDAEEEEAEPEKEPEAAPEEVPVFLGARGHLYLFQTPQGLVDFVRSDAEHDMSQLDGWSGLAERIAVEDVVPLAEDSYELDLVVKNLRGGHDAWDADLIIQAGEVARDLGFALRLNSVIEALAPGSPLDDLDEALRATTSGGIGGFMARRRVKKIGAEAAPLSWRTIIGKISSVVDWRD